VALTYISALIGFLHKIVTSMHEYEQDKDRCDCSIQRVNTNSVY
jgi:hypothetical protein